MKVLWICGLPNEVRISGFKDCLSPVPTVAWSWILGHLSPPKEVALHILCLVRGLIERDVHFDYQGAQWHCFSNLNHEKGFINACAEGEAPYFAYATTLAKDRSYCEEALIWHYKPEINKQGTVSFRHHATRVTITGEDPRCLNDLDFVTSKEHP